MLAQDELDGYGKVCSANRRLDNSISTSPLLYCNYNTMCNPSPWRYKAKGPSKHFSAFRQNSNHLHERTIRRRGAAQPRFAVAPA